VGEVEAGVVACLISMGSYHTRLLALFSAVTVILS